MASGVVPTRVGNGHANLAPYQSFPTADGDLIIAVGNDRQFGKLRGILGLPKLARDARFAAIPAQVTNRVALIPLIAHATLEWSSEALLVALEDTGVSAGPVNSIDQVFTDLQVISRALSTQVEGLDGEILPGLAAPIVMDGVRVSTTAASPRLAQHQGAVWRSRVAGSAPGSAEAA